MAFFSLIAATLLYTWNRYKKKKPVKAIAFAKESANISTFDSFSIETVEELDAAFTVFSSKVSLCSSLETFSVATQTSVDVFCVQTSASISSVTPENPPGVGFIAPTVAAALTFSDINPQVASIEMARNGRGLSESDTSEDHTPNSSQHESANEAMSRPLPLGIFNDPDNDIVEDSPNFLNGKLIPRVLVPEDLWAEAVDKDTWRETFFVPANMGGVLIGRFGKNVRELKQLWNADFSLNMCPGRQDTLLLKLSCPLEQKENVLHWITKRFKMKPSRTTIGNPNQLRRFLPFGEVVKVQIRSMYGLKELFVTIEDENYARYLEMQRDLDKDYASLTLSRMQLYEPVTSGTVAVLPHKHGFARALILKVLSTWPRYAFCFLLDHGTFGVVGLTEFRKIKAKYMRTPFQAVHVSWAHALPIYSDIPDLHILRTLFNSGNTCAFAVRMETCCKASVCFLEHVSRPPLAQGYMDTLALACRSGLYMVSPLCLFPNRQTWLNNCAQTYFPCPYSEIDYTQLVEYLPEDPAEQTIQSQPLAPSQSQNTATHRESVVKYGFRGRGRGFSRPFAGARRPPGRPNVCGSNAPRQYFAGPQSKAILQNTQPVAAFTPADRGRKRGGAVSRPRSDQKPVPVPRNNMSPSEPITRSS